MTASASDLLTTQKNNVVAINTVAAFLQVIYNNIPTTQLGQAAAGTSVGTLYTANSKVAAHINSIVICNTATATANIYLFIVPSGGTAGPSNAIFYGNPLPGNTTLDWQGYLIVPAGGTVQGYASTANVAITLSGGASV